MRDRWRLLPFRSVWGHRRNILEEMPGGCSIAEMEARYVRGCRNTSFQL